VFLIQLFDILKKHKIISIMLNIKYVANDSIIYPFNRDKGLEKLTFSIVKRINQIIIKKYPTR